MAETKLGPFLGVNNRKPDYALHMPKEGDFLRTAVNVDIDDAGLIRRRVGTALLQAMTNAHSLYMHTTTNGFLVRGSVLYAITLPAYSETLLKVLSSDAKMNFVHMGVADHYFSNGVDSGRITNGVYYPIGLPTPASPTISAIGGGLLKGWYQVGVSYTNTTTGEEGGISASSNLELSSTGGLRVTLPGATTGATHVNIYLSESNGTVPRLHSTVTAATASVDLSVLATGRPTTGRFEDPLPAGTLFAHNGRLCSFKDNMVYIGQPYRPGYYIPVAGYIPFPDTVTIAVSNQTGVFVAADKTYYIPGDLGNVESAIMDVLPYGAVPGTAFTVPNKTQWGWFGAKGLVLVGTSPEVQAVMSDNIDLTPPALGTSVVMEHDGYRHVVSCGWSVNLSNLAATSYTGWDFTSTNYLYGTQTTGIYYLNATAAVDASVGFGKQDFRTEQFKYMPAVYLGIDTLTTMSLRIQAPVAQDYSYPTRDYGAGMQMQRIDPGLGLKSNWFDLTLSNTAGGDFKLATVAFDPVVTLRRI
jgi:hypothetical protein